MPVDSAVRPAYGAVAKSLHWLIFILLIAQFAIAWTMPHIGRNTVPETLINLHFSLGALIIIVVVLRLLWRLTRPQPPRLATTPLWQHRAAQVLHGILYLLLIVLPFMGWASASGRGYDVSLFGIIPLPSLFLAKGSPYAGSIGDWHNWVSTYGLIGLVALHALVALYHHFMLHDETLRRMMPNRPSVST